MTLVLGVDLETYSAADIRNGAAAYAEHPSTGVHCAVLIQADAEGETNRCRLWIGKDKLPLWAVAHIQSGDPLLAHNAGFEHAIWTHVLGPRFNWPVPKTHQWEDTVELAAQIALPTSLEGLGDALGAKVTKDMEGNAVMKRYMKVVEAEPGRWLVPEPPRYDKAKLLAYCELDVETMFECYWRLPKGARRMRNVNRRVNERGVRIDTELVAAIADMVEQRKEELSAECFEITEGDMLSLTSPVALKKTLAEAGLKVSSLDKRAITELLQTQLDWNVQRLLELRLEAGKATSLAKLKRVPNMVNKDGRLRGAFRYCGAHTGRWSSTGIQVHNLPKPKLEDDELNQFRNVVRAGRIQEAKGLHSNLLEGLSSLLRSVFVANPGYDLLAADYSAIEARVLAWLAGEQSVLDVFNAGRDIYMEDAKAIGSDNRQLGKVQRLALGYGMGVVKFADTAAGYDVALSLKDARDVQQAWRKNNPAIVAFWHDLQDAVATAVRDRGEHVVGRVTVQGGKNCLRIVLPSGRSLHYWQPFQKDVERTIQTVNFDGELVNERVKMRELRFYREGPNRKSMKRDHTYGGKLVENVTQAVARDLLGAAIDRIDPHFPVVLHVHDSIASEVPTSFPASVRDDFCGLMAVNPKWADGLPVDVDGYRGPYFKG